MTQRRDGKALRDSAGREPGWNNLSKWIPYLVILQTIFLLLIFMKVFDLFPEFNNFEPLNDAYLQEERFQKQQSVVDKYAEPEDDPVQETHKPVRLEILNGCGVAGIAKRTADFLQLKGYDIRDYLNASRSDIEKTSIIVRSGAKSHGEALAATISFPVELIVMDSDPNLMDIDVTLLLGKDRSRYILPP